MNNDQRIVIPAATIIAQNYTKANRAPHDIWYLVIHDEETPQKPHEARNIAKMFHDQLPGQSRPGEHDGGTSAHRIVDNKELIVSVHWKDIAYAAPGANTNGIHWEQSGYVRDHKELWLDEYGTKQMNLLAKDVAHFAFKLGIPVRRLTVEQIRENAKLHIGKHRGIVGHSDVSKAFPTLGNHTDPGPNYPWHHFLHLVDDYHSEW